MRRFLGYLGALSPLKIAGAALLLGVCIDWAVVEMRRPQPAARAGAGAPALEREQRADQLRVWGEVLRADPTSSIARAQLAGIHLQLARESGDERHYELAESYARESLELTTNRNGKSFATLANALLARHEFVEAADVAAGAVEQFPDEPSYRALAGEIALELGRYEQARSLFGGLHVHRGQLSIAARLARWHETEGRDDDARGLLMESLAGASRRRDVSREQLAWFNFRLGEFERRRGKPRTAQRLFEAALAINDRDYRALNGLAQLHLDAGRYADAIRAASRAASVSRTPETLATLADALRAGGRSAEEARVIEAIRAMIGPEPAMFERAWYTVQLDRGLDVANVVAALERDAAVRADAPGLSLLAWALHTNGSNDSALVVVRRAKRTGTRDPILLFRSAAIHAAAGDYETARRDADLALRINDRFHWRHAADARALLRASPMRAAAAHARS